MKIIAIKGGLGNQLFEYAYGRNLELSGKKIIFDTSFFNGGKAKVDTARNFKLNNFKIETKAEFAIRKTPILNLFNKIRRKLGVPHDDHYQSEKHFSKIAEVVTREFGLRDKMSQGAENLLDLIQKTAIPVSVHIRRGDYIQNARTKQYNNGCSPEYYKKALETIAEKLGKEATPKIQLFVFSDDIDWVKNNLKFPYPATYASNPAIADYEELTLMSKCSHNVIANSSFSWWGAWLNPNPQKIVIAPERWLNTKPSSYKDIVPNSWIKI